MDGDDGDLSEGTEFSWSSRNKNKSVLARTLNRWFITELFYRILHVNIRILPLYQVSFLAASTALVLSPCGNSIFSRYFPPRPIPLADLALPPPA